MALSLDSIQPKIFTLRWCKVIFDRDLASLYGISTKVLKQAVRRNRDRFPEDFMFELTDEELKHWRSHFVTSNTWDKKGLRYKPYAFTEHWCLQASNVLRSEQAKEMSIAIIRGFTQMRQILASHDELKKLVTEYEDEIRKIWFEIEKLNRKSDRGSRTLIWFTDTHDW